MTPPARHRRHRRHRPDVSRVISFALAGVVALLLVVAAGDVMSTSDAEEQVTRATPPPTSALSGTNPANRSEALPASDSPASSSTAVPAPTPPPAPRVPPLPEPYEPDPGEVLADAKRLGGVVAQMLTTYEPDATLGDVVAGVTADPARADALLEAARVVHHAGMWSRGTVEYAQMGGHMNGRASIMVLVRQELGVRGLERSETRTMDVRLELDGSGAWVFDELASAGGVPVARPAELTPGAAAVVDDDRIRLPDSAVWDIYAGKTDEALLRVMAELAELTPYAAVVLGTGHPYHVFETDRVSRHSIGHAVDIYEIGSTRVIDGRSDDSTVRAAVEWLASRTDVKELGSPWLIPDAPTHTFTNEVHQDHIHIGVL